MTEETVQTEVLANDQLRIEILPELGGKIASIRTLPANLELLQTPLLPYAPRNLEMPFEDSDASGFDECLPSVSACTVSTPQGRANIPDHGEFWRIPWKVRRSREEIHLEATGSVLPLRFQRRLRLNANHLRIDYSVTNTARYHLEYAWSAHPLFTVEEGDRIHLPPSARSVMVEGSAHKRLGPNGSCHPWPLADMGRHGIIDLSLVQNASAKVGDKLFASAPAEGWAAIERARHNLRIQVRFDPQALPFLGLWLCYGGWPEGREATQNCVALEPCTAPADSLASAIREGFAKRLAPLEQHKWTVDIVIDAAN